jgi:hypothetical protein
MFAVSTARKIGLLATGGADCNPRRFHIVTW